MNIGENFFIYLNKNLLNEFSDVNNNMNTRRIIMFIIYTLFIIIMFLLIWIKFVNKLDKEIWRTR